jgi:hypothetical protein
MFQQFENIRQMLVNSNSVSIDQKVSHELQHNDGIFWRVFELLLREHVDHQRKVVIDFYMQPNNLYNLFDHGCGMFNIHLPYFNQSFDYYFHMFGGFLLADQNGIFELFKCLEFRMRSVYKLSSLTNALS